MSNGYGDAPELCDEDGVEALQRKIRKHWGQWAIVFKTHQPGFHASVRFNRVDLRSDMVNGLPRGLYLQRCETKRRGR